MYNWLCYNKRQWILILDNVDDASFLVNIPNTDSGQISRALKDYIPQGQNGSVLITTRTTEAALQLVERSGIVPVFPMNSVDALALCEKKLGKENLTEDIDELVVALDFMPLAIVQATAYISQRAPHFSVRQYLEHFRENDDAKTKLLDIESGQLRRDREAKNSIIITWHISFDHIRHIRPSAADLLSFMSMFDCQGIPEDLVRNGIKGENSSQGQPSRKSYNEYKYIDEFENDLIMLRNYSFVYTTGERLMEQPMERRTFEMHALVQLAMRKWLKINGQLQNWQRHFVHKLCTEVPTGEFENWAKCQVLFPHIKLSAEPESEDVLEKWATLQYRAAWYALRRGNLADGEKFALQSMEIRKNLFSPEHIIVLNSMEMVSLIYQLAGRWKEAELLHIQLSEARKRVQGQNHPATLASISYLATIYKNQGRWKEAQKLQIQVMETRKRVLGQENLDTLTSMNNLALTYKKQGLWDQAQKLQIQVMETRRRLLGQENPATLISMDNLASTYREQGRWNEAQMLEVQVMETSVRVLGPEHPATLTSMSNLALTYTNQGRLNEAEKLEVQATEMRNRILGLEHPDTLISMGNLASIYKNQGRWNEAQKLKEQVMETRKKILGPEHPDTLISMSNLASTYRDQGQLKEAEKLGIQVLETRKRTLGQEHRSTLISMGNLASTYRVQGRWKEAEELGVQVMEMRKSVLGKGHPDTLTSMANLAFTWKHMGQDAKALSLMEVCIRLRKRILGDAHPDTLSLMEECIQLRQQILGDAHPGHS